jgi:hypothetical protein
MGLFREFSNGGSARRSRRLRRDSSQRGAQKEHLRVLREFTGKKALL